MSAYFCSILAGGKYPSTTRQHNMSAYVKYDIEIIKFLYHELLRI